ncbi:hypothetical protein FRC03_005069 [Tulasnella sp. 419]|nr:hypothetical protein FRC03_005069 [Tulasnella sp. 419]
MSLNQLFGSQFGHPHRGMSHTHRFIDAVFYLTASLNSSCKTHHLLDIDYEVELLIEYVNVFVTFQILNQ